VRDLVELARWIGGRRIDARFLVHVLRGNRRKAGRWALDPPQTLRLLGIMAQPPASGALDARRQSPYNGASQRTGMRRAPQ
jgi:hypothetical protein